MVNLTEVFSVTLILFSVVHLLRPIPIVISPRKKAGLTNPARQPQVQDF